MSSWSSDPRLDRAHGHTRRGEVLQAEMIYRAILQDHADCVPAARAVAAFSVNRGDFDGALAILSSIIRHAPNDPALRLDHAQALWQQGEQDAASEILEALLKQDPSHHLAWLMLGQLREAAGDNHGALRAWYQAITRAQRAGQWMNRETTHQGIVATVMASIEKLRRGRRETLFDSFQGVRDSWGAKAVARVERALTGYLGEWDATPADPRQRPKFLYFPDLCEGPYHDPMLLPWAPTLRDAWRGIRAEAEALLAQDRDFESFLGLKPGQSREGYIGGSNPNAAWDAYFFYRRGQRFDAHHEACPFTSSVLDSVELCRVGHQAPEVCFSVIRPQSTIMAHHGVTNTRMVMHLPLIVPKQCALNIVDGEAHSWREGELMMFDDTFQHEAWNRSDEPRLILLMDCWNPYLTEPEKIAVKQLVEAIDALEN